MTTLYRCVGADGELLYVGISLRPWNRFSEHRGREWWVEVARIELEHFDSREAAAEAERRAIIDLQPRFNVVFSSRRPEVGVIVVPDEWLREDRFLNGEALADVLRVSENWLSVARARGLPHYRLAQNVIRYRFREVWDWLTEGGPR